MVRETFWRRMPGPKIISSMASLTLAVPHRTIIMQCSEASLMPDCAFAVIDEINSDFSTYHQELRPASVTKFSR
jgi:hypothetical protein